MHNLVNIDLYFLSFCVKLNEPSFQSAALKVTQTCCYEISLLQYGVDSFCMLCID